MDVNASRFHVLVTESDWVNRSVISQGTDNEPELEWDGVAGGLRLRAKLFAFRLPTATAVLTSPPLNNADNPAGQTGRGGVFDVYGNLYCLSPDRLSLLIRSIGSGAMSAFWPVSGGTPPQDGAGAIEGLTTGLAAPRPGSEAPGGFHTVLPPSSQFKVYRLDAIAVTVCHYLIAASAEAGGLLIFDLHGAGPPLFQPWPGMGSVKALLALDGGGIGVLVGNTLHRLGPDLKPCLATVSQPSLFKPADGEASAGADSPPVDTEAKPCQLDLSPALPAGAKVTAVALAGDARTLIVLGQPAYAPGQVWLGAIKLDGGLVPVREQTTLKVLDTPLNALIGVVSLIEVVSLNDRELPLAAYALALTDAMVDGQVLANPNPTDFSLFVLAASGDQAFRFACILDGDGLKVGIAREYWPMRRYTGYGLASVPAGMVLQAYPDARVLYATADRFAPLLSLPQPRYGRQAQLVTEPLDGREPGCVWHRLLLDMRLPSGVQVRVETRAIDAPSIAAAKLDLANLPWQSEPALLRSVRGSELPWRDSGQSPEGTFEILLQEAHGRWLQVRLTVEADGQRSPLLRAMRVWYPRFSYLKEYLPPVYRADAASAAFLDRFLALFEGEFTRWEDRIVQAQWLFDARTAPAQTLEWLAGWLGLAFDATVDEPRRRLMIRHAMAAYARRGTVSGLLLGATLAWEKAVEESWFTVPEQLAERPHGLRLQELFGLLPPLPKNAWLPAQGRATLLAALGNDPGLSDPAELAAVLSGTSQTVVAGTASRSSVLRSALGFLPRSAVEELRFWSAWNTASTPVLPANEAETPQDRQAWTDYLDASQPCAPLRQRWQDFLGRRWRRISALNEAWGTRWQGFERIPCPDQLPPTEAALADWHRFEARVLRGLANAHRFRVVLPLPAGPLDIHELARRRQSVLRVVEREKPAHTVAEVRFGFDLFRIGEARLGLDTRLEEGLARRPELAALGYSVNAATPALLGRTEIGGAIPVPPRPQPPADRIGLDRG